MSDRSGFQAFEKAFVTAEKLRVGRGASEGMQALKTLLYCRGEQKHSAALKGGVTAERRVTCRTPPAPRRECPWPPRSAAYGLHEAPCIESSLSSPPSPSPFSSALRWPGCAKQEENNRGASRSHPRERGERLLVPPHAAPRRARGCTRSLSPLGFEVRRVSFTA